MCQKTGSARVVNLVSCLILLGSLAGCSSSPSSPSSLAESQSETDVIREDLWVEAQANVTLLSRKLGQADEKNFRNGVEYSAGKIVHETLAVLTERSFDLGTNVIDLTPMAEGLSVFEAGKGGALRDELQERLALALLKSADAGAGAVKRVSESAPSGGSGHYLRLAAPAGLSSRLNAGEDAFTFVTVNGAQLEQLLKVQVNQLLVELAQSLRP